VQRQIAAKNFVHKELFMKCEKKSERPLSDLHQRYTIGSLPKKDFEGRLFQYLLDNHERYRIFEGNKNRWNDFLSWLYPRIVRAIVLYRELGSSFDAYITGLVYRASKEFQHREASNSLTEYTCWEARAQEMVACESEPEYLTSYAQPKFSAIAHNAVQGFPAEDAITLPKDIKPQQILLLLLKSYFFVSEEFVNRVACAIGMNTGTVMQMIEELRKLRSEREGKITSLRDRVYSQYYRCLTYQKRMDTAQAGSEHRKKWEGRYQRARCRFAKMRTRLKKMRVGAPNRMISLVTGIPKGTVDSSLFAIKNHLASFTGGIG